MKKILELKQTIIYGPVSSRRLGASMGINLLPGRSKLCSFDCVYCQYGWTKVHQGDAEGCEGIPSPGDVAEALRRSLQALAEPPAYLTFSGNGEASIIKDFHLHVDQVRKVRDQLVPLAKTAILSNSSTVHQPDVRAALASLDYAIMKLDCGDEETFARYNRPCRGVTLEGITEGLIKLSKERPVTIQALFAKGESGNFSPLSIEGWIGRLERIRPQAVQIYTLHRGHPDPALAAISGEELRVVKEQAAQAGIEVEVF